MEILQNNGGENKVFIEDNMNNEYVEQFYHISRKDKDIFTVFIGDDISVDMVDEIIYDMECDTLNFNLSTGGFATKCIKSDEILCITTKDENIVEILISKLPMYLQENGFTDTYPKFEFNISDCMYITKIYINESEYIEIPMTQTHITMLGTLDHISNLVYYLTLGRPGFINELCNRKIMQIIIPKDDTKASGVMTYELGEDGICITGGEIKEELVPWHNFFKLVMDGTWEVDFIDD
jgi:hypothetical protein